MSITLLRGRGIRQITAGLGNLDREVFEAVAESPSPLLDATMPVLTRAADHSKLWLGIAAALAATGSPAARRGAGRGVVSLAVTSLVTNQVAKRLWTRRRPDRRLVPLLRRSRRTPTSNSLPSGHSASAAAFAVGVGLESPPVGLGLSLLAAGFGIGAAIAVLGGRLVPPVVPAQLPATESLRIPAPPRPDGEGVVLVVNPDSGSGTGARVVEEVRSALPRAEIVELADRQDADRALDQASQWAQVLAVAGGDGTVSAAAEIAVRRGLPLAVFPAGTFNHFAKDIGCDTVERTVQAIRMGSVSAVDLVCLNGRQMVVNTASIGAYPHFVAIREKWEHRIGKTLAGLYAMVRTLLADQPVRIRYDGKTVQTSLFFLGNSVYLPAGFAPARRTRIDDGLIDVRFLDTGRPLAMLRIIAALLLGRIERSPLYHELQVPEFSFEALDGPTPIARDGEIGEPVSQASFANRYRALAVYRPG